jgi:hypothetical protein
MIIARIVTIVRNATMRKVDGTNSSLLPLFEV